MAVDPRHAALGPAPADHPSRLGERLDPACDLGDLDGHARSCAVLGLGIFLIATSPSRIVAVTDLTNCYSPPVPSPCGRIVYQGGMLNAAFTVLFGLTLVGAAAWLLWELWSAAEPKPITDDFLRLLNDSFGRSWRNPLKWPWARIAWAYGFTLVGVTLTAALGVTIWTLAFSADSQKPPTIKIDTSQSFRLEQ